jgi:hypothetical protein
MKLSLFLKSFDSCSPSSARKLGPAGRQRTVAALDPGARPGEEDLEEAGEVWWPPSMRALRRWPEISQLLYWTQVMMLAAGAARRRHRNL